MSSYSLTVTVLQPYSLWRDLHFQEGDIYTRHTWRTARVHMCHCLTRKGWNWLQKYENAESSILATIECAFWPLPCIAYEQTDTYSIERHPPRLIIAQCRYQKTMSGRPFCLVWLIIPASNVSITNSRLGLYLTYIKTILLLHLITFFIQMSFNGRY